VKGLAAELWDPIKGSVERINDGKPLANEIAIPLNFEPYGSRLVVFTNRVLPAQQKTASSTGREIDLSTNWQVTFAGQGKVATYSRLQSWTDDLQTRYFSGTATYEREVEINDDVLRGNRRVRLDLGNPTTVTEQTLRAGMQAWLDGPVREAAVVYVNDRKAGSVWCPPYALEVTEFLRPGKNRIRILVANTAMNYMAGHSLPDYRLLNLRFGERFQPQEMDKVQPVPSGLLGKVSLIVE
jgi:hypothetical protein